MCRRRQADCITALPLVMEESEAAEQVSPDRPCHQQYTKYPVMQTITSNAQADCVSIAITVVTHVQLAGHLVFLPMSCSASQVEAALPAAAKPLIEAPMGSYADVISSYLTGNQDSGAGGAAEPALEPASAVPATATNKVAPAVVLEQVLCAARV